MINSAAIENSWGGQLKASLPWWNFLTYIFEYKERLDKVSQYKNECFHCDDKSTGVFTFGATVIRARENREREHDVGNQPE